MENNMSDLEKRLTETIEKHMHPLREGVEQLQHDLDVEKAKSASYLSALAYCLDQTEGAFNQPENVLIRRMVRVHDTVIGIGNAYKIMWDKVKR